MSMTSNLLHEPKTVEVRIPTPPTATGRNTTWAKDLQSVAAKAKSGHDWQGDWLRCGQLHDLPQGTVVVVGGSKGSRKYGEKLARVYIVVDDGLLCKVDEAVDDEWAVELRDDAREWLALSWRERCQRAIQTALDDLQEPEPSYRLQEYRKAKEVGWLRGEAPDRQIWSAGSWQTLSATWEESSVQGVIRVNEEILSGTEQEFAQQLAQWQARLQSLQAALAQFKEQASTIQERPEVDVARQAFLALSDEERVRLLDEICGAR